MHRTEDGGYSWDVISPDLTTDDENLQVSSGGLTIDNVGVDYGTTLFAIAESPLVEGVIWVGSNDGLVHVTRDGGKTWTNVTQFIPDMPKLGTVSNIEPSRFKPGKAYISIDFHQVNSRDPYIYKTENYGKSWKLITTGIPRSMLSYVHIVREDPVRPGMLLCGTENAVYFSLNDGDSWMPLRNNMPAAPIHWLTIQEHFSDLVIGTYGRGFWILDDITPLRQLNENILLSEAYLFKLRAAYRFQRTKLPGTGGGKYAEDPPYGASINYYLQDVPSDNITITILDESGSKVKTFKGTKKKGINRVYWNLRHEDSLDVQLRTPPLGHPGLAFGPDRIRYNKEGWRKLKVEGSGPNGPLAIPGTYTVELIINGKKFTGQLEVRKDPKSEATIEHIRDQIKLALAIRDRVTELAKMGNSIQRIRKQIDDLEELVQHKEGLHSIANTTAELDKKFIDLEQNLYQLRGTGASENLLRFPSRLYSHLKMLGKYVMTGDSKPTKSKYEVYEELSQRLDNYLGRYDKLVNNDLVKFNEMLKEKNILNIVVSKM